MGNWQTHLLAVEKRTKGDESEKACACDAAQASSAAVVGNFIVVVVVVVVVVVMPSWCVGVGVGGGLVGDARQLELLLPGSEWLGRMMRPTAGPIGGGSWQKPR
jgi:hypothetical protein